MLIAVILILFMIISYSYYYEKTWSVMKMKKNSKSSILCYLNDILYENKVPALRASSSAGFSQNEEYFVVCLKVYEVYAECLDVLNVFRMNQKLQATVIGDSIV